MFAHLIPPSFDIVLPFLDLSSAEAPEDPGRDMILLLAAAALALVSVLSADVVFHFRHHTAATRKDTMAKIPQISAPIPVPIRDKISNPNPMPINKSP